MQTKLWTVVRIIEGKLQFLDSTGAYADLHFGTLVTPDREHAWRTAREAKGLLLSVDGLPLPTVIAEFVLAVEQAFRPAKAA